MRIKTNYVHLRTQNQQMLRMKFFKYKRLFDVGAITQKEYEAKEENNYEGTNCKCITQT